MCWWRFWFIPNFRCDIRRVYRVYANQRNKSSESIDAPRYHCPENYYCTRRIDSTFIQDKTNMTNDTNFEVKSNPIPSIMEPIDETPSLTMAVIIPLFIKISLFVLPVPFISRAICDFVLVCPHFSCCEMNSFGWQYKRDSYTWWSEWVRPHAHDYRNYIDNELTHPIQIDIKGTLIWIAS